MRDPRYVKVLEAVKVPGARNELEKLIETIEDPRNCAAFEPHQLGRLLCALFPLRKRSSRQRNAPSSSSSSSSKPKGDGPNSKSKLKPKSKFKNRPAQDKAVLYSDRYLRKNASRAIRFPFHQSDLDLLQPRNILSGPVPIEFNRRLAYSDNPKLAEQMLAEEDEERAKQMLGQDSELYPSDDTDDMDGSCGLDSQVASSTQLNRATSKCCLLKQSKAGHIEHTSSECRTQLCPKSQTSNAFKKIPVFAETHEEEAQADGRDPTSCNEFEQSDTPTLETDTSLERDDESLCDASPQADSILGGSNVRSGEHRDQAPKTACPESDKLSTHPPLARDPRQQ